eukprot:403368084
MVDVSKKQPTVRTAIAQSIIQLNKEAFDQVQQKQLSKGDALTMAEVAGIMAVKRTQDLIPLCHQIAVDFTRFKFYFDEIKLQIVVQCHVQVTDKTGCEMEAMTGANIAALTIYDMCKPVYKGVEIINSKLLVKTGGKSGDYMNIKETERII